MKKQNTGNPLATLFYILLVCTISMFIITACQKTDNILKPETPKEIVIPEKFFSTNPSTNPAVMGAQKFLKNQNDKYHFTEEFVSRIGMPFWNKALVYTNTANTTIGTESVGGPSTVVYIPFVRDSQNYVNASVLIRMTGTDTSYRIICDWQYSEFGFEHSDTSWSARDIFAIFSILDKSVFGHKKYRVKDGRIFGYPRETQLIATEAPQAGRIGTETFNLECTPHTVCVTAEPSTNSVSTETVCTTSYTCALVWTGGGSGPGPLPPGGGGGGGGGGTGGPGDGGPVLPPNPCPVLPRGYTIETASNPCDTTAWEPEPLQPNENIDGLDNICQSSFKFHQIIAPTNGVGGWRVAGTTNIHMKLLNTGTGEYVQLILPTIYFGIPIYRANGDYYSANFAKFIASIAVDWAEEQVLMYLNSVGGTLDMVALEQYYRQKINQKMQEVGGSATLSPGSNVTIVDLGTASYGYPIIGCL